MSALGKAWKCTKKAALYAGLAAGIHMGGMTITQIATTELSERIRDQKHLEQVVKEERKKLNCNGKDITSYFMTAYDVGESVLNHDGTYTMTVGGGMARRNVVRHELYHICDNHLREGGNFITYFFWYEPQATLYDTFGWKL